MISFLNALHLQKKCIQQSVQVVSRSSGPGDPMLWERSRERLKCLVIKFGLC